MSASLETSLYIGITKTRFDLFDEVELKMKDGTTVQGTISGFDGTDRFYLETEQETLRIDPADIEDYIS